MQHQTRLSAAITVFCLFFTPTAASAQFWPGHGYGGGGYGAWGAAVAEHADATQRNLAQQQHLASERIAAQQSAAMQSSIRNTLSTQADMRTQSILSQQQSNRDWWFQMQQQQMAQRRAMPAGAVSRPDPTFVPTAPASSVPPVATDIIPWPPVLWDSRFSEQRAAVEAPYRRDAGTQATRTVADYESMIEAAGQMKLLLDAMTAEISAQDYLHTEKFLDQLAAEARGQIEKE
jgi:hypothetical protein